MSLESFEDKLKLEMHDLSKNPRAGTWEKLAASLPPERKKRRFALLYTISLILSVSAIFLYSNLKSGSEQIITKHSESPTERNNTITEDTKAETDIENSVQQTKQTEKLKQSRSHKIAKTLNEYFKPVEDANTVNMAESVTNTNFVGLHRMQSLSSFSMFKTGFPKFENLNAAVFKDSSLKSIHTKSVRKFRSVLGAVLYTGYCDPGTSILSAYKDQQPYREEYENRTKNDKRGKSFGFSVYYGKELNHNRWTIGLNYLQISYEMSVKNTNKEILRGAATSFYRFDFNASDSFQASSPDKGGAYVKNTLSYLGIPMSFSKVVWKKNKFSVNLYSELCLNFLLEHKGLLNQEGSGLYVKNAVSPQNNLKNIHGSFGLGAELNYSIHKKILFTVRPRFTGTLSPIESAQIKTGYKLMTLGIGLSYLY